jgi:hypothetical protein
MLGLVIGVGKLVQKFMNIARRNTALPGNHPASTVNLLLGRH